MSNPESIIRIGIVDDDLLFTQLLKKFIEGHSYLQVVFSAGSGQAFLDHHYSTPINLLILDLRMQEVNGLDLLTQLEKAQSETKIIVLSTFYRHSFIGQMLKLGACAFLPKEIDKDAFIHIIKEVYSNGHYLSADQIEALKSQMSPKIPQLHLPQKNGLTKREITIVKLVCQQMSTKEIAKELFISPKTVESHKSNLILKTGVKNMAGLVIYAIQNKLINPAEIVLIER